MTVSPIGALMSAATAAPIGAQPAAAAGQAAQTGAASDNFGNVVVNALQGMQDTQANASNLAVQAATGDLVDVHNYTIAATEASLQTQLTVAVRDRAVEAFQSGIARAHAAGQLVRGDPSRGLDDQACGLPTGPAAIPAHRWPAC